VESTVFARRKTNETNLGFWGGIEKSGGIMQLLYLQEEIHFKTKKFHSWANETINLLLKLMRITLVLYL